VSSVEDRARPHFVGLTVGLVLAVGVGVGAAALDKLSSQSYLHSDTWGIVVGVGRFVLNSGVVWGILAFVAGRLTRRAWAAPLSGVITLSVAVGAYYLYAATLGDRVWGIRPLLPSITRWMLVAIVAGLLLGFLGWLSRRAGRAALIGIVAPTVVALGALVVAAPGYRSDPIALGLNVLVVAACGVWLVLMLRARGRLLEDGVIQ
jgi:hypothetical protein